MINRSKTLAALAVSLLALGGCATQTLARSDARDVGDLVYQATQKMAEHLPRYVDRSKPIIVTTMVSVDDLTRSSTFGRLSSQLILNKLSQNGYLVRDVTYMHALDINAATGEMMLTRDAARLSQDMHAQAVVVGTYARGGKQIYLNIRMLDAAGGTVISSADVAIPYDEDTAPLVDAASTNVIATK